MLKPGLVRFILSSIVIIYHLSAYIFIGSLAVYCFFMLSGYWVTYMYENKYVKFDKPVVTFYLSRIFRLFPVYFLFAILAFAAYALFKPKIINTIAAYDAVTAARFWFSNFCLLGYNQLTHKPIIPAWSLDIELQFYIVLPLLLMIVKGKLMKPALVFFALLTLVISAYAPISIFSTTVIVYLFYFSIGIYIYRNQIKFSKQVEITFDVLFLLVLVAHYLLGFTAFYKPIKEHAHYEFYFNQCLSLLTIPMICNCVYNKSDKLDRVLGEMSFVLYLCHWITIIPYNYYVADLGKIQRLPIMLVYLLVTYVLAYFIFKFYDKPVDSLRRKWLEKRWEKQSVKAVI